MAYIAGKHIRRRNDMAAVDHYEHVVRLVRRAQWIVERHSLPQYGEPELRPRLDVPHTTDQQIQAVLTQLAEIEPLVARFATELLPPLNEVRSWLQESDIETAPH